MSNGKYKSKKQLKKEGLMTGKGKIVSEGTYKQSKAIKDVLSGIRESTPRVVPKHLIKKQVTSITPKKLMKKIAKKIIKKGFTPIKESEKKTNII